MKLTTAIFSFCLTIALLVSCTKEVAQILPTPSYAGGNIIISSQDGSHLGVTRYNLNGVFQDFIAHYRDVVNSYPRGLALFDSTSFLVALDGEDRVQQLSFDGTTSTFYASAQLSGNIYDIAYDSRGYYYVIESNRIERFDSSGNRTNPLYINTTVGACVLSNPRHLIVNSNGDLVVVQTGGGGKILTYDVSTDTSSCSSSVGFANVPYALVEHSNGRLYVVTQGNEQIYEADPDGSNPVVIWSTDLTIINNPSAIVEAPDGTLLVASSATHTIEKIQTDGTRIGTTPFIKDIYSRYIADILIIPGDL